MKYCLKIFSVLSFLLTAACNTPKSCIPVVEVPGKICQPVIALNSDIPVLYQAGFDIYKYSFSGLIAFRNMPDEEETRIVFLSEVGIKIMEFSCKRNEIINTYCIEPLQKKAALKFTRQLLSLLINTPECKSVCQPAASDKNDYFCKLKRGYQIVEIKNGYRSYVLLHEGRNKIASGEYEQNSTPIAITVNMKLKTRIQLKKVENAFK
ncbi:MAG: hypothetical protein JW894_12995 [Bacteroidales bacterium]|nr:hypothetical protein [Bacteroidales bacterium]